MLAIAMPHRATKGLAEISTRVFAACRALKATASADLFKHNSRQWHLLDAHLLRDIGGYAVGSGEGPFAGALGRA